MIASHARIERLDAKAWPVRAWGGRRSGGVLRELWRRCSPRAGTTA